MIKAKILLEEILGVPKSWFASYGREHIKDVSVLDLYRTKMNELQQEGFGSSMAGIHDKHVKKSMSIARGKAVAILRV